jgi:iron complex transport system substrate-binding protein
VTQDLCAVCAVSSGELASACPVGAEVISLDPRTFGEVADSIRLLGARLGVADRAEEIANRMQRTAQTAAVAVRGLPPRRVFFAEWLEPPFCAGHWLPEMIGLAGGADVLGRSGEPSFVTTWEMVFAHEPELVVVGPCGFGADDAAARAYGIDWPVPAVAVDGDGYYSRPGPRLADGVVQLAHSSIRTRCRTQDCRRSSLWRGSRVPSGRRRSLPEPRDSEVSWLSAKSGVIPALSRNGDAPA